MKIAKPYAERARVPVLDSEFFADGCLGLCKASKKFDPSRGFTFLTYASDYVLGEISDGIRRRTKPGTAGAKSPRQVTGHDAAMVSLQERGPSPELQAESLDEAEMIQEAVAGLPEMHREVIRGRMAGEKMQAIADRIGVSKQRVERVEKVALSLLLDMIEF